MVYYAHAVVPVADLRTEPTLEPRVTNMHDRRRDSQVLVGEVVRVLGELSGWSRVEAPDQLTGHFTGAVHPYAGWVQSDALERIEPLGQSRHTHSSLSEEQRPKVVAYARAFLGHPYLWGGMSFHDPLYTRCATGIDCSGLAKRAYECAGCLLPRDSKDQWKVTVPTFPLKPGDLLFSSPPGSPVNHVMVWTGTSIIEATDADARVVREVTFEEKFGIPLSAISGPETTTQACTIYFHSFAA